MNYELRNYTERVRNNNQQIPTNSETYQQIPRLAEGGTTHKALHTLTIGHVQLSGRIAASTGIFGCAVIGLLNLPILIIITIIIIIQAIIIIMLGASWHYMDN